MGRAPCCEKVGLKRGPWTPEEDQKLVTYINENGHGSWRALPKKAGLLRCGKSCRLRWTNYLRPDIKRGEFSIAEEQSIIQLHALLGNRWSAIASHLPKRTDNEIKNYWNTHLKKKLVKMGLDPATHKPTVDNTFLSSNADPGANTETGKANLFLKVANSPSSGSMTNHMAQWESARLEAESRLMQESQMRAKGLWRSGSGLPNPINVAPLPTAKPWSAAPLNGFANNSAACADALKALGAVELMHALHNWEKSLQGQAGMMWPEAWRLPGAHYPLREAQTESSCSSHCSDANTNTPPLGAAGPHRLDHLSPTSTLCSLDSHCIKQKALQSAIVSGPLTGAHIRKLSWNDALAPLPPKIELPVSVPSPKAASGFDVQGISCKMEEDSSTFSSLMHDAVFGTDGTVSTYVSSLEEAVSTSKTVAKEDVADEGARVRDGSGGVNSDATGEGTDTKMFVTHKGFGGSAGDKGTCEKQTSIDGDAKNMVVESTGGATDEGVSVAKDADKNSCSEALTHNACISEQGGARNVTSSEHGEINMAGDTKEGVVDLNNVDIDDNSKSDDVDSNEGKRMCNVGEMVGAEVFEDLPKLKSKASTPHLTSYCALLSEEIPDYWSSILLKEPNLQQVDMTF